MKKCWILKLDSYLDSYHLSRFKKAVEARNLIASSIHTIFVEVYEIQFFRANFTPFCEYVFRLSFLTTLNIYKDYFKGRQRLRKYEAKFCSCKL